MRARAQQLGGSFQAGPAEGGGWLVEARLPLRREARA
jgi:signal transduction histidine kinase